ncbi:CLIP domain-containing serine protease 2-like [Harmonia axyridis]|uniref:CLIP domain-containing serine protease 2-like n=1 Tax=Harmonia axyridis TaxID=115357 RepID=UPI001E27628C|nr:CLIP domain-containing serine protease 2-like [Harmonia axyridis]
MALYYSIIIDLLFLLSLKVYVRADPPCRTPNNDIGECIIIKECTALYAILQKRPLSSADANFLRQSQCGFVGLVPKVCCPPTTSPLPTLPASTSNPFTSIPVNTEETNGGAVSSNLLPDKFTCGQDTNNRIFGGEKAELDEFPWMALIEYEKPNRHRGFYCGGVLISKRYVLTASHCLKGKDLPKTWKLVSVRLGEYDTEQDRDCVNNGFNTECSDPTVNVPVEERIAHEKYDPTDLNQYHDIALLRLIRDVQYTNYIKPICLPLAEEEKSKTYNGNRLTVAGWGKTENRSESNVKLKLQVPVQSQQTCNSIYSAARVTLGEYQICAGGEKGKDSCRGDSGGPLMTISTDKDGEVNWYAAGVVSFGPSPCGMEGWPGVYTKVSKYVSWIVSKLKP